MGKRIEKAKDKVIDKVIVQDEEPEDITGRFVLSINTVVI